MIGDRVVVWGKRSGGVMESGSVVIDESKMRKEMVGMVGGVGEVIRERGRVDDGVVGRSDGWWCGRR